jgi:mannose-6-phosphate isomerase-like protein (cupin superfamily)
MRIVEQADLDSDFEGHEFGSAVSIIFEKTDKAGTGPRLHQHPYSETFVIRTGRALFTVGDQRLVGVGGQVLVVPAFTPHKFSVLGGGLYEAIHIHANDRFVTEWLEDF